MTAAERRQIGQAIREYDHAREEAGRALLCRLAREHAPEPAGQLGQFVAAFNMLTPERARSLRPHRKMGLTAARLSQPKPRKRIVDRKAMLAYREAHPHCEVIGCSLPPCPEPHHLISRKMKGDDVPANLLRLCADHHREWHRGPATWAQRYIHQLTAEARSKVMAALRYEEQAHGE